MKKTFFMALAFLCIATTTQGGEKLETFEYPFQKKRSRPLFEVENPDLPVPQRTFSRRGGDYLAVPRAHRPRRTNELYPDRPPLPRQNAIADFDVYLNENSSAPNIVVTPPQ